MKYFSTSILSISLLSFSTSFAHSSEFSQIDFVPFEVLVTLKGDADVKSILAEQPYLQLDKKEADFSLLKVSQTRSLLFSSDSYASETLALVEQLKRHPNVEDAQLNYIYHFAYTPNDPLYPEQWNLPLINISTAWDITRGNSNIKIAVVDSGRPPIVHTDLNWSATGFNAESPGAAPFDTGSYWHGTHVAGIIGSRINNSRGGAGICPSCQLVAVKASQYSAPHNRQNLTTELIKSGIDWAVDQNIQVINMSFEMGNASTPAPCATTDTLVRNAVKRAADNGVVMVAAAGNHSINVNNTTPASCPGVISVAATDRNNNLASYSNRGSNIGISAPGGGKHWGDQAHSPLSADVSCPSPLYSSEVSNTDGIISTWIHGNTVLNPNTSQLEQCYRYLGGTSMAAPHVSGVAGLMLSRNAWLRPEQIKTVITNTATTLSSCGSNCGPGLLNAYGAVNGVASLTSGPCSARASSSAVCKIDSIAQYKNSASAVTESIFAYGRVWKFNVSGLQTDRTRKLVGVTRYKDGPCAAAPAGEECTLDTVSIVDFPGLGYVESITAYGKGWNYDMNGNLWAGNPFQLSSIARFASGPCAYASSPSACKFEARVLVDIPGHGFLEGINAYGRYFVYNVSGTLLESGYTHDVPRYSSGPCSYRPSGSLCNIDSRQVRVDNTGNVIETLVAYGRFFEWRNDVPTSNSGGLLTSTGRMR